MSRRQRVNGYLVNPMHIRMGNLLDRIWNSRFLPTFIPFSVFRNRLHPAKALAMTPSRFLKDIKVYFTKKTVHTKKLPITSFF